MGTCLSAECRSPVPGSPMSPSPGVRKRKNSRKISSSSSDYYLRGEPLHKIPGRFFLNGSTEVASLFTQQGRKGTNQDAMIVWENFGSRTDTVFCGVFDGHGPYGHLVARRVRDSLPLKLSSHWKINVNGEVVLREISTNATPSINRGNSSSISVEGEVGGLLEIMEVDKQPGIFETLKESFLKAFKFMDRELRIHTNIDCFCSGTTAVTLIKQGNYMVIGNVGDSRAVLGTRDDDGDLIALQLTVDLKPSLPAEAERIQKCRGRVFALQDEPEVARVWLPNNDSPGLAMARAFGDFCLKDFGLISVPDISCRCISEKDQFVVLATDGIWDVLSNKEVVDIVASAPARSSAARAVVESAVRAWRHRYPSSKIDDCAVVCLFLDSNNLPAASNIENKEKIASANQADSNSQKDLSGPTTFMESSRAGQTDVEGSKEEPSEQEESELESENGWYALEGVSRVNTLLNLPRFVPGREERAFGQMRDCT